MALQSPQCSATCMQVLASFTEDLSLFKRPVSLTTLKLDWKLVRAATLKWDSSWPLSMGPILHIKFWSTLTFLISYWIDWARTQFFQLDKYLFISYLHNLIMCFLMCEYLFCICVSLRSEYLNIFLPFFIPVNQRYSYTFSGSFLLNNNIFETIRKLSRFR